MLFHGKMFYSECNVIILIFISNVMSTYGFVLRDTYKLLLKDNADYIVDLVINEDDYEMIDKNQLKEFTVDDKTLKQFDKLVSNVYNKNVKSYNYGIETSTCYTIETHSESEDTITYIEHRTTHTIKKREITKDNEVDYNYKVLLNEYYEQSDNEAMSQNASAPAEITYDSNLVVTEIAEYGFINTFKKIFLTRHDTNYNKSIGLQAIKSLVNDYKNRRRPAIDINRRLWRIIQIWFLVYLVFAVPLWCTRGWCCCCLFCKFFKPRQTIDEAKKYLISNPPGVFKTRNSEVHYDPTDREKETYEEFDHFLKTN